LWGRAHTLVHLRNSNRRTIDLIDSLHRTLQNCHITGRAVLLSLVALSFRQCDLPFVESIVPERMMENKFEDMPKQPTKSEAESAGRLLKPA